MALCPSSHADLGRLQIVLAVQQERKLDFNVDFDFRLSNIECPACDELSYSIAYSAMNFSESKEMETNLKCTPRLCGARVFILVRKSDSIVGDVVSSIYDLS